MKLIHLPILSLMVASAASAADLSPNILGPLSNASQHLIQDPLAVGNYQLGLDFVESKSYIMNPQETDTRPSTIIQRRLNLEVGLPAAMEFGLSLLDTQEGFIPDPSTGYEAVDHSSKPMGGKTWLRWNMLHTSWVSTALTLQYQPGMSTAASYHQASQDRTSLGLDVKFQPFSGFETAVYGSYSRRQDERYQNLLLGDEKLFGLRLAYGTENIGIFGDASSRHLHSTNGLHQNAKELFARQYQAGLYAGTRNLQFNAFALIPDTNRYIGIPERGFGGSISIRLGAEASDQVQDTPVDAMKAVVKDDAPAEETAKVVKEPELKFIETNEPDEFQLLTERNQRNAIKNKIETPAEKAEREMRESLEKEQQLKIQAAMELEKRQRLQTDGLKQQIRQDDARHQEYKDDVDQEINRYTLPDQEELNWSGLTPQ